MLTLFLDTGTLFLAAVSCGLFIFEMFLCKDLYLGIVMQVWVIFEFLRKKMQDENDAEPDDVFLECVGIIALLIGFYKLVL